MRWWGPSRFFQVSREQLLLEKKALNCSSTVRRAILRNFQTFIMQQTLHTIFQKQEVDANYKKLSQKNPPPTIMQIK